MKNDLILRLEVESDNISWTVHVDQVAIEIGDERLSRLGPPVGPRAETGKVELHGRERNHFVFVFDRASLFLLQFLDCFFNVYMI